MTDNSIFSKLPQFWEAEFHRDMAALNVSVQPPARASWVVGAPGAAAVPGRAPQAHVHRGRAQASLLSPAGPPSGRLDPGQRVRARDRELRPEDRGQRLRVSAAPRRPRSIPGEAPGRAAARLARGPGAGLPMPGAAQRAGHGSAARGLSEGPAGGRPPSPCPSSHGMEHGLSSGPLSLRGQRVLDGVPPNSPLRDSRVVASQGTGGEDCSAHMGSTAEPQPCHVSPGQGGRAGGSCWPHPARPEPPAALLTPLGAQPGTWGHSCLAVACPGDRGKGDRCGELLARHPLGSPQLRPPKQPRVRVGPARSLVASAP